MRLCRKTGCAHEASATCSFHYPLKQVWIAPLSADPQPGSYDLCEDHADRLVAPLGWLLTDIRAEAEVETLRPEALEPSPAAGLAV